ncbi:MAG: alpha/beta hydrolase, partial [Desulfovibrio sp.]|nr:alpha/beta hydrolase [Desulfovibrio sp.]
LDLSFWGGSEGRPRNAVLPDMYAEDFSAAADYLGTRPFVDRERMGVLGICGSGSFAISAAKIDPRLKAVATVSMYDMGAANRNALRHSLTLEQRKAILREAAAQRYVEFNGGAAKYTSGTVHELTEKSTPIEREFYDFYRTPRGEFTPKGQSPLLTTHPTLTSNVKFMNFYPFNDIETISPRPMLFVTGDTAHSREFSEDAYRLAAEPKELYIVPNAGHVDLYDRVSLIPFDKLGDFFKKSL